MNVCCDNLVAYGANSLTIVLRFNISNSCSDDKICSSSPSSLPRLLVILRRIF